jgi:hypothetical protein
MVELYLHSPTRLRDMVLNSLSAGISLRFLAYSMYGRTHWGAETGNTRISFLEPGVTGHTDFIVVRYSATNNGLPCNN